MQENRGEQSDPGSYRQRCYRLQVDADNSSLATFNVTVAESDLLIRAVDVSLQNFSRERLMYYRYQLESFLEQFPEVRFQLYPFDPPEYALLPKVVSSMVAAGNQAGVGPMAAVAGAVAEAVGRDLLALSPVVMVENGGDVFLSGASSYTVGIFAGQSSFSGKLGIQINRPENFSAGICTSSSTVGHSLSLGMADAVCIYADSASFADALATAMGNRIRTRDDLEPTIQKALAFDSVYGAVAILGDEMAAGGELELVSLSQK